MSEKRTVVLCTGLFDDRVTPPGLSSLPERYRETALGIDTGAMTETEWDHVLRLILENDRCITL